MTGRRLHLSGATECLPSFPRKSGEHLSSSGFACFVVSGNFHSAIPTNLHPVIPRCETSFLSSAIPDNRLALNAQDSACAEWWIHPYGNLRSRHSMNPHHVIPTNLHPVILRTCIPSSSRVSRNIRHLNELASCHSHEPASCHSHEPASRHIPTNSDISVIPTKVNPGRSVSLVQISG